MDLISGNEDSDLLVRFARLEGDRTSAYREINSRRAAFGRNLVVDPNRLGAGAREIHLNKRRRRARIAFCDCKVLQGDDRTLLDVEPNRSGGGGGAFLQAANKTIANNSE